MSRGRLFLVCITLFFLLGTGVIWILNLENIIRGSWSTTLTAAFGIIGVIFAFLQWSIPLTPLGTKESRNLSTNTQIEEASLKQVQGQPTTSKGTIVVYEKRKNIGQNIISKDVATETRISEANIVERRVNGSKIISAIFPNLEPDYYKVYFSDYSNETKVSVFAGQITEIDWRRDLKKEKRYSDVRGNTMFIIVGGIIFFASKYWSIPYLDIVGAILAILSLLGVVIELFLLLFD